MAFLPESAETLSRRIEIFVRIKYSQSKMMMNGEVSA